MGGPCKNLEKHLWTLPSRNLIWRGIQSMMAENPERAEETERRNWAELPDDLLSVVFMKLGAVVILQSAEAVCRSWRQLALDPKFYLRIQISCTPKDAIPMEKLARKAIDRSAGQAEAFFAKYCGSDEPLTYIADRTTEMKRLTLIFPLLEKCAVLGSIRCMHPPRMHNGCWESGIDLQEPRESTFMLKTLLYSNTSSHRSRLMWIPMLASKQMW